MCRQVICRKCSKITWAGCGMHVDQVMAGVSKSNRCECKEKSNSDNSSSGGFFARILGQK